MRHARQVLSSIFLSLTFLSFSFADTDATAETEENNAPRVEVESRPMSHDKKEMMLQRRAQEAFKEQQESQQGLIRRAKCTSTTEFMLAPAKAATFLPCSAVRADSIHWLTSSSLYGDVVEIEDGSQWKISANDAYKVLYWHSGDPVKIIPNTSYFSHFNYYVVNQITGDYARANLFLGPIALGPYTHWIVAMDRTNRQLFLENGTSWYVSSSDDYIFGDWEINDTVIIGANPTWFTYYDSILINVNMNNFARSYKFE